VTPEHKGHDKQRNTVVQLQRQQPQGQPAAEAVSALPQALVRASVQVPVAGHRVQFTFQEPDEQHLLARLEAFLERMALP